MVEFKWRDEMQLSALDAEKFYSIEYDYKLCAVTFSHTQRSALDIELFNQVFHLNSSSLLEMKFSLDWDDLRIKFYLEETEGDRLFGSNKPTGLAVEIFIETSPSGFWMKVLFGNQSNMIVETFLNKYHITCNRNEIIIGVTRKSSDKEFEEKEE